VLDPDISPPELPRTFVLDPETIVPAARPMSDFSLERVADEVVLFDAEFTRYHTLNGVAYDVWRLCDGRRTLSEIASNVDRGDAMLDVIAATVEQLGEGGLLQAPETHFESTLRRRAVLKLVAAGAVAAIGLPVVSSITAPDASAANSGSCTSTKECPPGRCCCCHDNNTNCDCQIAGQCEANQQKFCLP
jgi:hypothetical protein